MSNPHSVAFTMIVLAAMLGGAAPAAEDDIDDIRLNAGILPGIKSIESNGGTADAKARIEGGASISFQHGEFIHDSQWGWVVGIDFFYDVQKGSTPQVDFKSDAHGDAIDAGLVYRVNGRYQVELTPSYGLGGDYLKTNRVTGHGIFWKYGATLAGFVELTGRMQIGANLGWESFHGKAQADFASVGSDQSVRYKGDGLVGGVTIGCRL